MSELIKILVFENAAEDTEVVTHLLIKEGLQFEIKIAGDKPSYLQALQHYKPDVILSDHTLPLFNAEEALELAQQQLPGSVFILVTDAVSEEFAAAIIKKGADDYILKGQLGRLPAAINAALKYREAEKEKNKAQQQLEKSQEQYRISLDRITDAFVALDTNWCYTYMNKKAGEIFQRKPAEMVGKHIWTEFPEGVDQSFYKAYYRAMKEQQYIHVEEYYPPYDKWFENHIYPSPEGLSIFFRDITQRKYAEQLNEKIQKENDALINSTSDLLWSVSNDYTLIAANGAFIKGLKDNGGFIIKPGDNILSAEHFPEDYLQYWKVLYQKGLSGESVITEVFTPQAQSSDLLWFELNIEPIFNEDKIIGIACSMRNITERKKAEERIKESEEKQRTILQSLLDYVLILNAEGFIQYINHLIPGIREEEVVGTNWLLWLHEEDQPKALKAIGKTLSTGKFSEIQIRSIGAERKTAWYNIKIVRMPKIINQQVLLVATDITEQKKSDEKIRLTELRLQKAKEIGKFGYWHQDINSDTVWASKEAMRIYGFAIDEGELQRATIASCIIDVDKVKEAAINLVEHGKEYNIDIRINPADGSPMKYISALAELEKNEKGEPVRIVGTLQDNTEQKKAEQAIKESEEKYRTLVEQASDAIFIADTTGRLITVNTSACKLAQYPEKELLQMSIYDFAVMKDLQKNPFHFDELKQGKTVITERVMKGKDAREQHVEITAKMLSDGRFLAFVKDITERIKAAEAINQLNIDLELRVKERTAELEKTNVELEEINDLFVGREARIIELKEELEALKTKLK